MNNSLSGIFKVVSQTEDYSSFRGTMNKIHIVKSINRKDGYETRITVISQGKRSTLIDYLFGKLLWDELNSRERDLFFLLPEITIDKTIFNTLRALNNGINKKLIRRRIEEDPFLGLRKISRGKYLAIKGQCDFLLKEETVYPRRTKPYSGYTKHYKDKGSLSPTKEIYISIEDTPVLNVSDDIIYEYLSVGVIPLLSKEVIFTLKSSKKNETENKFNINLNLL